jgi:spermidine synthase
MRRFLISALVYLALFATGSAGLIYQVAWQKYLARLVGNDAIAIAITLALFLSGLSLGYAACGRMSGKTRRPLRMYAYIEALIGLWALLFPRLFAGVDALAVHWRFTPPWGQAGEGLLAGAALIWLPTLLMGATVPFMTQAAAATAARATRAHAAVYGVNTAGAFAGALAASFYLIPKLGLPATVRATALLNLGAALLFLALSLRRDESLDLAGTGETQRPESARFSGRQLTALALLSGMMAMILENTLARFLTLTIGGSAQVFSIIVAVFVLAIAAGSFAVARMDRLPVSLLFGSQAALALLLMGLFLTFNDWPYGAHLLRVGFTSTASGYLFYYAAVVAALLLLLGLPVALMGMTLPVVFHELRPEAGNAGSISGRLLAWNAAGCLAGSLLGGIVLYSVFDLSRIYLLAPLLAAAGALIAAGPLPRFSRLAAGLLCLLALAVLIRRPGYRPDGFAVGVFRTRTPQRSTYEGAAAFNRDYLTGFDVVSLRDDALSRVAVLEVTLAEPAANPSAGGMTPHPEPVGRSLLVNGKPDSNTHGDRATLRMMAHLPALLSGRREKGLIIGLGTGVTAGELTLYPELRRIDVAEISPLVVKALPLFGAYTQRVHEDPRLNIELGDAILLLRRSREKWDFIGSEPSNLWVAGVEQLFTQEFYRQVDDHLADDGVFVQWIHLYESDMNLIGTVANTLHRQFPYVSAFRGNPYDLLLVASRHPLDDKVWQRAGDTLRDNAAVRQSLAEIGAGSVEGLKKQQLPGFEEFAADSARYDIQTLDHPRLQSIANRAFFMGYVIREDVFRGYAPAAPEGDADSSPPATEESKSNPPKPAPQSGPHD